VNRVGRLLSILLGAWSCACTIQYAEPRVQFDEREYAKFEGDGPEAIEGQAFLKAPDGTVKYAAGNEVDLNRSRGIRPRSGTGQSSAPSFSRAERI